MSRSAHAAGKSAPGRGLGVEVGVTAQPCGNDARKRQMTAV
ncbi:MAG: hypothetical protein ACOY7P_02575 [Pseudomonadota bacterium]